MSADALILSRPPSVFWFLFHGEKELAPQGETPAKRRAGSSRPTIKRSITAPSSAPFGGTFPLRGKAFQEDLCKHTHYQRVR